MARSPKHVFRPPTTVRVIDLITARLKKIAYPESDAGFVIYDQNLTFRHRCASPHLLLAAPGRYPYDNFGSALRTVARPDLSAMLLHNSLDDRESEPGAATAPGKEGVKDPWKVFDLKTRA